MCKLIGKVLLTFSFIFCNAVCPYLEAVSILQSQVSLLMASDLTSQGRSRGQLQNGAAAHLLSSLYVLAVTPVDKIPEFRF